MTAPLKALAGDYGKDIAYSTLAFICTPFPFRVIRGLISQTARPGLLRQLLFTKRALCSQAVSLQRTHLSGAHIVTVIDLLLVRMEDCILALLETRPVTSVKPAPEPSGFGTIKYQQRLIAAASLPGAYLQSCQHVYL